MARTAEAAVKNGAVEPKTWNETLSTLKLFSELQDSHRGMEDADFFRLQVSYLMASIWRFVDDETWSQILEHSLPPRGCRRRTRSQPPSARSSAPRCSLRCLNRRAKMASTLISATSD